jgi:hypothetical protein
MTPELTADCTTKTLLDAFKHHPVFVLTPSVLIVLYCYCLPQIVYNRNGVKVTATPVDHYRTGGPVAYRLDWQGLSFTYSGGACDTA